jgi:hypothetical protein
MSAEIKAFRPAPTQRAPLPSDHVSVVVVLPTVRIDLYVDASLREQALAVEAAINLLRPQPGGVLTRAEIDKWLAELEAARRTLERLAHGGGAA